MPKRSFSSNWSSAVTSVVSVSAPVEMASELLSLSISLCVLLVPTAAVDDDDDEAENLNREMIQ